MINLLILLCEETNIPGEKGLNYINKIIEWQRTTCEKKDSWDEHPKQTHYFHWKDDDNETQTDFKVWLQTSLILFILFKKPIILLLYLRHKEQFLYSNFFLKNLLTYVSCVWKPLFLHHFLSLPLYWTQIRNRSLCLKSVSCVFILLLDEV